MSTEELSKFIARWVGIAFLIVGILEFIDHFSGFYIYQKWQSLRVTMIEDRGLAWIAPPVVLLVLSPLLAKLLIDNKDISELNKLKTAVFFTLSLLCLSFVIVGENQSLLMLYRGGSFPSIFSSNFSFFLHYHGEASVALFLSALFVFKTISSANKT